MQPDGTVQKRLRSLGTRAESGRAGLWDRSQVDSSNTAPFVAVRIILQALALVQDAEAGALDGGDVDERIRTAVIGNDEAVPALSAEPLDRTLRNGGPPKRPRSDGSGANRLRNPDTMPRTGVIGPTASPPRTQTNAMLSFRR